MTKGRLILFKSNMQHINLTNAKWDNMISNVYFKKTSSNLKNWISLLLWYCFLGTWHDAICWSFTVSPVKGLFGGFVEMPFQWLDFPICLNSLNQIRFRWKHLEVGKAFLLLFFTLLIQCQLKRKSKLLLLMNLLNFAIITQSWTVQLHIKHVIYVVRNARLSVF